MIAAAPMNPPPRIASLVPSLTELVVALGLGPWLVARTGFCVHPREALLAVPKVGGTKDVNLAKLRRLAPTHVLVNVDENRLDTVQALREFVPEVMVTHPNAPRDNLALLGQLEAAFGAIAGVADRAAALRRELDGELAACAAVAWPERRVLYLIWREPWMTVARDTYIAQMLAAVNWRTCPEQQGGEAGAARYPVVEPGATWLREVERVLLSSEPYPFTEAHVEMARSLVPAAEVQLIDAELVSWYGPRAAAGLRYLRRLASDCARTPWNC